jgi:biotin carboxylase
VRTVVYVAPLFRPNTNRFLRAFCALPDVRVAVVGMDDPSALDADLRARVAAFARVRDAGDADQLTTATAELRARLGRVDVLTGSLEELQIPVAVARERLGIPGIHEEVARNFREKARMKEVLGRAGIPVARHRLVHARAEAHAFAAEVGYPLVAKPPAGLGARATWRVRTPEELDEAVDQLHVSPSRPIVCEEFVTGRENTCETVMIGGRVVWHSGTRYLNAPLEVIENPWMQYCVLLPREETEEFLDFHPVNDRAIRALGLETGLTHLEWFLRPDGRPMVSEVGARPPGANIMPLMTWAFDADLVARWCELTVFERFEPLERKYAVGTAFFRGKGRGKVVAVHGLAQAHAEVGVHVVDRSLPLVGAPRSSSYEGEGWAIVRAEDTATVLHALRRLVELVRVEYSDS